MNSEAVLGLANYEVTGIEHSGTVVRISARYLGSFACPYCQGEKLRTKGRYLRAVRHESLRLARALGPFRRFSLAHPKLLILRGGGFGLSFI